MGVNGGRVSRTGICIVRIPSALNVLVNFLASAPSGKPIRQKTIDK